MFYNIEQDFILNTQNNKTGWERRTIVDEPRLSELVETYMSLDFEVKVEDFDPGQFPEECSECILADPGKYKVIFTRKRT